MTEVVLVEDQWLAQNFQRELESQFGTVRVLVDFAELIDELDRVASRSSEDRPVIVLDPGVPGVCRLDAVRQTRLRDDRSRIVVWTGTRDPAFLSGALLDGAMAAIHKHRPPSELGDAIIRVAEGRYVCEPLQAQWFLDFFAYLEAYREMRVHNRGGHVWTDTQLRRASVEPSWLLRLDEIAAGDRLALDDRWFADMLAEVRALWITPYLRETLIVLAVRKTRRQTAEALGKSERSVQGFCSKLSVLLMPKRYISNSASKGLSAPGRGRGLALAAWVIENHAGCELALEDHDFLDRGA